MKGDVLRIKFSSLWAKLEPERMYPGAILTTIRSARNPNKQEERYEYYRSYVGSECEYVLTSPSWTPLGEGIVMGVGYMPGSQIPLEFIKQDTHPHYTRLMFHQLLKRFYGDENPMCSIIFTSVGQVSKDYRDIHRMERDIPIEDYYIEGSQIPRDPGKTFFDY